MTEVKAKGHRQGDTLTDVPEGTVIERPDGNRVTVTGGSYVLNQPGTYRVADQEVQVKE